MVKYRRHVLFQTVLAIDIVIVMCCSFIVNFISFQVLPFEWISFLIVLLLAALMVTIVRPSLVHADSIFLSGSRLAFWASHRSVLFLAVRSSKMLYPVYPTSSCKIIHFIKSDNQFHFILKNNQTAEAPSNPLLNPP